MRAYKQQHLKRLDHSVLFLCLIVLTCTIVYPCARLLLEALSDWQWDTIRGRAGRLAIFNTIWMSMASVFTSCVVGTLVAFVVTRYRFPGRNALAALAYLPFALPPLVGTLSFFYLISSVGFIPRMMQEWLGFDSFSINGPVAVLLIHTYSFSVYFYAMVSSSLESMDVSQLEAARTLGASKAKVFWNVTIPHLKPALMGASLLSFMTSAASFSAPYFFGDDFPYLSVEIYNERSQFNNGGAMTLSVVLAIVSLLGVVLFRSKHSPGATGTKGTPRVIASPSGKLLTGLIAWVCMLLLLTPHLNIVYLSLVNHREWQDEVFPTIFTLENYTSLFQDASTFKPIRNSSWMSAFAALGCLLVGLPAAYLIGRQRIGGRMVNLLIMLPWALPGTVVAMNLIIAFNDPDLPKSMQLYNTVALLPLAYFVRFIPLLTRMATASVSQFDGTLIEAGQTLGASRGYCFHRVIVPLLAPSLLAATALVFASCLGEFVATILLYTPSNLPIGIQIFQQWRGSGLGSAFAYSVFLMLLVTITLYATTRRKKG